MNKTFEEWLQENYTEYDFPGYWIDKNNYPIYSREDLVKKFNDLNIIEELRTRLKKYENT